MTHWGWYWKVKKKHKAKTLCSNLTSLDSFILFKGKNRYQFIMPGYDLIVIPLDDYVAITYGENRRILNRIPLEGQKCNYGGYRYYFKCPLCQKRMRILYLAQNSVFLCRKCLNLGYQSQCLRPSQRYLKISQRAKEIITDKGGDLYINKPSRMHTNRYEKLRDKYFRYENKAHQACNDELRLWYGAKAEPYLE